MKESYGEGIASYPGPESCVGAREGADEALTGESAGEVLSREKYTPSKDGSSGVPTLLNGAEGHTPSAASARHLGDPARSVDPRHARTLHAREPGGPASAWEEGATGRIEKPKGVRR